MKNKIQEADKLLVEGKFLLAKELLLDLLYTTEDVTTERIIRNRLKETEAKIKKCPYSLEITHTFKKEILFCTLKIKCNNIDVTRMLEQIFKETHKKNYSPESSVELITEGSSVKLKLSGRDIDERCNFCKNFIRKTQDNINKESIIIKGNCYLEQ